MSKNRKKLFVENILIYGLGSVMNMVIPFIMLPLISRLLPNSGYYGVNDTVNIVISFGSAIAMMGMYDSMYRFYFDKDDAIYHKKVCSSTLFTVAITGFFVMIVIILLRNYLTELLFSNSKYSPLIVICGLNIWVSSINIIVAAPTRIQNQRLRYILIQTLTPIISYSISILLIVKGEFIYALPLASLISSTIICITYFIFNKNDFSLSYFNLKILKPMLRFGIPLMPVFIFYWILSSVGRIVITKTWGLEYTGIYAASGKIASVSQLIYSAFSGGWQYFAFSTMKDKDYVKLISRVFDYLSGVTFLSTALLILAIKPIFKIMLPIEYEAGIIVVPALFLAPLILMLRQAIGMQFQVKKMSLIGTLTIAFGAVIAIILYFLLTPRLGIKGTAIASLTGYVASLLITIIILKKMKLILVSKRIYVGAILTTIIMTSHISNDSTLITYILALIECIILILIYLGDIMLLFKEVKKSLLYKKRNTNLRN